MKHKIIATLYYEKWFFADIAMFCSAILDYFSDDELPPLMTNKKKELIRELPEFTSYLQRALAKGVSISTIREIIVKFTDKKVLDYPGGLISFKDIHENLIKNLGDFQ